MDILSRIDELNKETETVLVKTSKSLPENYKKIFADIKNVLLDAAKADDEKRKVGTNTAKKKETLEEYYNENIYIAGGSLSELFIEGYDEKPKDLDIFITSHTHRAIGNLESEDFAEMLNQYVGSFGLEERKELESSTYSTFMTITNIIKGTHKDYPELNIEIIFTRDSRMDFDLSFREFYSDGENIFATNTALEAIRKKEIKYNTSTTSVQSIFRAKEFEKRYGYNIELGNEKVLYQLMKINEKKHPTLVRDIYEATKKYKTEEKIMNIEKVLASMSVSPEEEKELEDLKFVEEIKEEMALSKYVKRKQYLSDKGWGSDKVWEYDIPDSVNNHSSYRHQKTGEPISLEVQVELNKMEESQTRELKMKSIFKQPDKNELEQTLSGLTNDFLIKLQDLGYEKTNSKSSEETEFYLNKLDRYSLGIGDLDLFLKSEWFSTNYGENANVIKKALCSEKIYVKISDENKIWDMKGKYGTKADMKFEILISYAKGAGENWHKLEIHQLNDKLSLGVMREYMYLSEKRFKAIEGMIKDEMSKIQPRDTFNYDPKQIGKQFGIQTNRYNLITKEQVEEIKQRVKNARVVSEDDLPF